MTLVYNVKLHISIIKNRSEELRNRMESQVTRAVIRKLDSGSWQYFHITNENVVSQALIIMHKALPQLCKISHLIQSPVTALVLGISILGFLAAPSKEIFCYGKRCRRAGNGLNLCRDKQSLENDCRTEESKWSPRRNKAGKSISEGKWGKVLILKNYRRAKLRLSVGGWVEWVGRKEGRGRNLE